MPTSTLEKVSKVCQLKMSSVEDMWEESKAAAKKSQPEESGAFYGLTMSIFKKKLSKSCLKKLNWKRTGKSNSMRNINSRQEFLLAFAKAKEIEINLIGTHEGLWLADVFSGSRLLKKFDFEPKLSYWLEGKRKPLRTKVKELLADGIKIKNLKDLVVDLKGRLDKYQQPKKPYATIYLYTIEIANVRYMFGVNKESKVLKEFDFYQEKTYWRKISAKDEASDVINELVNSDMVTLINKADLVQQGLYIIKKTNPSIPFNNVNDWKDIRMLNKKRPIFLHANIVSSDQSYRSVIFTLWEQLDKLVNRRLKKILGEESFEYVEKMFDDNNFSLAGSPTDPSDPSLIQAYLGKKQKTEKMFQEASIIRLPSLNKMVKKVLLNKKGVIPKLTKFSSMIELFSADPKEKQKQEEKTLKAYKKLYRPWKFGSLSNTLVTV